jgi:protein-tyrosine phosphatase
MAEGIMRQRMKSVGLTGHLDSCGFESFHVGDAPDSRAIQVARKHGVDITSHRARLFETADFDQFDHILVMDAGHYRNVTRRARSEADRNKVMYVLDLIYPGQHREVMDPWYHDIQAFETVFHQLDEACRQLAFQLKTTRQHDPY